MTVIARGPQNEKKGLLMVYREMTREMEIKIKQKIWIHIWVLYIPEDEHRLNFWVSEDFQIRYKQKGVIDVAGTSEVSLWCQKRDVTCGTNDRAQTSIV